jgi:hypothetical protein
MINQRLFGFPLFKDADCVFCRMPKRAGFDTDMGCSVPQQIFPKQRSYRDFVASRKLSDLVIENTTVLALLQI